MKPVIVTDSSCDLNDALKRTVDITRVPFALTSNDHEYIDDENMDIQQFLADIAASDEVTKSAARSPQYFIDAIGDAAEAFIITISSRLSSTFQNAQVAAEELQQLGRRVHVFDSKCASAGETSFMMRVHELIEKGLSFDEIVGKAEEIARTNFTYFILNDYSTLVKSGRLPRLAGRILSGLSIRPICRGVNGEIGIKSIARGMAKAAERMAEHIREEDAPFAERVLYITHINDSQMAATVRDAIIDRVAFKAVQIMEGTGLNTAYANQGGIIIGF